MSEPDGTQFRELYSDLRAVTPHVELSSDTVLDQPFKLDTAENDSKTKRADDAVSNPPKWERIIPILSWVKQKQKPAGRDWGMLSRKADPQKLTIQTNKHVADEDTKEEDAGPLWVNDRIDKTSSGHTPSPISQLVPTHTMSGRTLVNSSFVSPQHMSFVDNEPRASVCFDDHNTTSDRNNANDDGPFLDYFWHAHSLLQVSSKLRQLIVSLNPFLRDRNAYLADRVAYHYAGQVYKLEEWVRPVLGISGSYEAQLFKPFVCTWNACGHSSSFSSLTEWSIHVEARHRSQKWLTHDPSDEQCPFCGTTWHTWHSQENHIAKHLLSIGQAVIQGSWTSIEADPGASLGIWQRAPAELQASEPGTQSTVDVQIPAQKEKHPEGSLGSGSHQAEAKDTALTLLTTAVSMPSATLPTQGTRFRQIGMATIQVKMAISPEMTLPTSEEADGSDSDDGFSEQSFDASEARDNDHDANNTTTDGSWAGGSLGAHQGSPHESGSGSGSGSGILGEGAGQGNGAGDGERRGKKRRKGEGTLVTLGNRQRLACPYQVFEPTMLDCFRRGRRNPEGGCKDLNRLRQHLGRCHKRSRRCGRCWSSFEDDDSARQHERAAACNEKPLSAFERLMNVEDEPHIQPPQVRMLEEDAWWAIFQRLIPGMAERNVDVLKLEYSPYYVHRDVNILIPAINIPDSLFEVRLPEPLENSMSHMDFAADTGATSANPLTFMSQDLSVPVFQVPGPPSLGSIPEVTMSGSGLATPFSATSSDQSSVWTQPSISTQATMSASPRSASASLAGGLSQTQLEKNHTRLKTQYTQVKTENAQLREHKFANRADLEQAEGILEELLNSDGLSQGLFDRLSQVSDILIGMRDRLT